MDSGGEFGLSLANLRPGAEETRVLIPCGRCTLSIGWNGALGRIEVPNPGVMLTDLNSTTNDGVTAARGTETKSLVSY